MIMKYEKTAEATDDLIDNKIRVVPKNSQKIIQRQLQMRMITKYLKKYIYLQKKDKKLLAI